MIETWRKHWPEYAMEAFGLGAFMVSACVFTTLLEHPLSPLHHALPSEFVRRALMGLAMGATAVAIIYSPWGRRSGAHMNPAVTLTFLWLKRIAGADAFAYAIAQCAGALLGVWLCHALVTEVGDPAVNWVVTQPGAGGVKTAFVAEFGISFLLMFVVLAVSSRRRFESWTGWVAGACVALFITFEAPLSGMSMNPARSLGSAVPSGEWHAFWLYVFAPPLGMCCAALIQTRLQRARETTCAKLRHCAQVRCIFCGSEPQVPGTKTR